MKEINGEYIGLIVWQNYNFLSAFKGFHKLFFPKGLKLQKKKDYNYSFLKLNKGKY